MCICGDCEKQKKNTEAKKKEGADKCAATKAKKEKKLRLASAELVAGKVFLIINTQNAKKNGPETKLLERTHLIC